MSVLQFVLIIVIVAVLAILLVVYISARSNGSRFTFDIGGQTPRASGGEDGSAESTVKGRLIGQGLLSGGMFAVLLARLWSMQLVSKDEYTKLADANRTRTISTAAPRGRILDRNGKELVTNRPSLTVVATTDVLEDELELQLLANVLGMPKIAVKRKIQDQSAGAQSARVVATDASRRVVAYLGEHADYFPHVTIEERQVRHYPYGNLAAHVLGYTGNVTQEQIDKSKDKTDEDAISYELGDLVGQAGIEYQYESVLQGIRGAQTVYVNANGVVTDYSTSVEAVAGSDVVLTIDADIQKGAEDALAFAIQKAREKGNKDCDSGAVVVLDAKDGSVLAMASAPTYNPSVFIGGISSDDWAALSDEESSYPLMNRCIDGQYMAASTVKPLITLSALDHGIATAGTTFNCTGFWTGFGKASGQYCWKRSGHGIMTLQSGITYSCDVVFYEVGKGFWYADDKDKWGMQDTMRTWGMGSKTGIDLPSEAAGRVPDPDWKWDYYSSFSDEDRKWKGGDNTNLAIGQGDLLVTPLQQALTYMGLANNGVQWSPHLLKSVRSHSGDGSIMDYKVSQRLSVQEDQARLDLVHAGMLGVIYDEDPSMAKHFTNLDVKVAGKTGSGERTGESATGWLCTYAPADDPKYVVVAVIEQGGFGATSAMYAVRNTLAAIYNQPDTALADTSSAIQ